MPQMLFKILQQVTKGQMDDLLPDSSSQEKLVNKFCQLFINKIKKIRSQFQNSNLYRPPLRNCLTLTHFRPISQQKLLNNMKKATSDMDPCNINFLMEFKEALLDTWTIIINT